MTMVTHPNNEDEFENYRRTAASDLLSNAQRNIYQRGRSFWLQSLCVHLANHGYQAQWNNPSCCKLKKMPSALKEFSPFICALHFKIQQL